MRPENARAALRLKMTLNNRNDVRELSGNVRMSCAGVCVSMASAGNVTGPDELAATKEQAHGGEAGGNECSFSFTGPSSIVVVESRRNGGEAAPSGESE